MKSYRYVITGIFMMLTFSLSAAEKDFGLGVIIGEPTGISAKKWINETEAYDGGVAWSFSENPSIQIHGDYLVHRYGVLTNGGSSVRTPIYYGLGVRVKLENNDDDDDSSRNNDDSIFGIRVPLGINYIYAGSPFELFAEIVPIMDLIPDSDFDFNVALGVRYYFD